MGYEDIFEKANELIDCLNLVDSLDFIDYIIYQIESNEYCDNVGYQEFLNEKY